MLRPKWLFPFFFVCALSACGKSTESKSVSGTPTSNPTTTPSPTSASSKWSSTQLSQSTQTCASNGDSSYTYSQWKSFCSCFYTKTAELYTYQEFVNDFDTVWQTLEQNGAVQTCISQSGMQS